MDQKGVMVYPPAPHVVDKKIIEPSAEFREEAVKVVWSIVIFIGLYVLMIIGAVLLMGLCAAAGFFLISSLPNFFTVILGVGLIAFGLLVLFFLFKFIFAAKTEDRSHLIEVTRQEQPLLFEFIDKLTQETNTPFPKRVYLAADVNAYVFYNSGFWSMFFPVRKNLQIGLGLVNTVNVSEFKAILAHEFGHFSQRSMKLGSYVYNMNKVIYNLVYDSNDYQNTLKRWGNLSNYIYIFTQLTLALVYGIQGVLKKQYQNINKRNMALSRQMEFHADAVAASVSGSRPLVSCLRRLDVSHICYQRMLASYDSWCNTNKKAVNLYPDHTEVMKHYAAMYNLELQDDLLTITANSFQYFPQSRLVIKNQWASHPETADREAHLNALNVDAEIVKSPAWSVFTNVEELQQRMTANIYSTIIFNGEPVPVDSQTFQKLYYEDVEKYSFDGAYKGYYDNRRIEAFDTVGASSQPIERKSLEEILTDEVVIMPARMAILEVEIRTMESLSLPDSDISIFEFKGEKCNKGHLPSLLKSVQQELDDIKADILKTDKEIFALYARSSASAGEEYAKMFAAGNRATEEWKTVEAMMQEVMQLYQDNVTDGMATAVNYNMKRKQEPIKEQIKKLLEDEAYITCYTEVEKRRLEKFISRHYEYYTGNELDSEAIDLFMDAMSIYRSILSLYAFHVQKQTLAMQALTIAKAKNVPEGIL